ncbi:transposase, IS4 family protein [Mycobacteroides abscessus subsp. abscessus]|nr:transposase, IS4 family protein [Mycobacteroides abscessus subsp. abscessus]SID24354.1 transposase, IS4 family protein [Mycobacteroides abscessus subsp. abscessus]SID40611.1 transposase, IS4 family protein [Mycobacteroides abscessus subsp. abscessus]SII63162.1 transposase, IS4 family protein [Mycobacteroides abscessus subsp. abscessus]SKW15910.1 transposase, IS4 family protein [Mycobacteroides abscessus subsp. abscessus]
MQVSHRFTPESAVFDDDNLVSCAGLVPVMTLAAQTGLVEMLAEKVHIAETRIKSGAANPAPKLATLIAGMCAGADSIDDADVVRSGGMKTMFGGVVLARDQQGRFDQDRAGGAVLATAPPPRSLLW